MGDTMRRKLKIYTHNSLLWMENLNMAYPLTRATSHQCRDAFLEELLKPYEALPETESILSSASSSSTKIRFGEITEFTASFNAEENMLNLNQMRKTIEARTSLSTVKSENTRLIGADLSKLLKARYGNIAYALGFVAVLYQLQELRDRLRIICEGWRLSIQTEKSLRMFSWSIKDYFTRFHLPDQSYLDALERELGQQIECYKFRMDLKEIERLLGAVVDDFRSKADICQNSMLLIQDAEMSIEELLTKSQKEAAAAHYKVALASIKAPRSPDPDHSRTKAVNAKFYHIDFVYPIEARYRIKWSQTVMEQSIFYDELGIKKIADEIQRVRDQIEETTNLWGISSITYDIQITQFQNSITTHEVAYELNLEQWESTIQATRHRLAKSKDDLKYYRDQIPIFRRKIAEVLTLLERQKEEERRSTLKSRKSSRHSSLKKKALKAAKKTKK